MPRDIPRRTVSTAPSCELMSLVAAVVIAGCATSSPSPRITNQGVGCDASRVAEVTRQRGLDAAAVRCVAGNFGEPGWYLDVRHEEENAETWTFGVIHPGGAEIVPVRTLTVLLDSIHDDGRWEIESLSAADLDGDGIDEILELSRSRPRAPNAHVARMFTVHQIVDGKLVHIPGEGLAYHHVNILTKAVTECVSSLRLDRAGRATHIVIDAIVARGPRASTCPSVGRHVFTARGGKLVELP